MITFFALWALGAAVAAPEGGPGAEIEELPTEGDLIPGIPPGPPPPPEQVQQIAYEIGLQLRCPVCQGLSVADSTSNAAVQMQNMIRKLVAAGYDEPQIKEFFVQRYGEWILLAPRSGLLWLVPGLGLGLGLGRAGYAMMKYRREPDPAAIAEGSRAPRDRYEQRLLEQLED
ncbi:MAG: cytochrome c-type biogenesis protein CcmH [Myxococcota bacterium]